MYDVIKLDRDISKIEILANVINKYKTLRWESFLVDRVEKNFVKYN